jgi:hypothetical protein
MVQVLGLAKATNIVADRVGLPLSISSAATPQPWSLDSPATAIPFDFGDSLE